MESVWYCGMSENENQSNQHIVVTQCNVRSINVTVKINVKEKVISSTCLEDRETLSVTGRQDKSTEVTGDV